MCESLIEFHLKKYNLYSQDSHYEHYKKNGSSTRFFIIYLFKLLRIGIIILLHKVSNINVLQKRTPKQILKRQDNYDIKSLFLTTIILRFSLLLTKYRYLTV